MAHVSEQIRRIAQDMCDRIASLESHSSSLGSNATGPGAVPPLSLLVDRATDADLEHLLREASRLRSEADAVVAATAGVVAKRSVRDLGYSGLAKRNGDHNAVDMVQRLTGSTRVEAARQVKLGEAMGEADAATHPTGNSTDLLHEPETGSSIEPSRPTPEAPWHEPLTRAVRNRLLKPEAVTIIMRGLGEPNERVSVEDLRLSAEQILDDAAGVNADELGRRARLIRDQIDPVGVRLRWDQHFENRKWRFSRSAEGVRTAWVEFDDESAAFIDQLVGVGMRPRRGGPRMVDPAEAERAKQLLDDPRSNDQLVFDLIMATLKAGVEADPTVAFGSRQPGVRIVITEEQFHRRDADGRLTGTGFNEDTGEAIPGNIIERNICTSGTRLVTVDEHNNPLDVGREERCFTTKQRVGLAIRDGGCVFEDCTKPPSYTEAHHINEWAADNGLTDIADGVLLCHEDHLLVHNNGWKIIREGSNYFAIPPASVDPEQKPRPIRSKSTLKQPPPKALQARAAENRQTPPDPAGAAGPPVDPTTVPEKPPSGEAMEAEELITRTPPPLPPRQAPGSPPGPSAPSGSSRPANRGRSPESEPHGRRRESNYRVLDSWYVPPEKPSP
ncbi:DUF222 domain-containing protein [Mycetocola zhadangensis]|uniref:DUF222 domain-containing protein n=1 Tax=Mycetocola zhadangensis TaxID=1164595 RepID=A0A3L7ITD4_9MICO|nr:DUF222 domain-containing protein [Mycetocola zhadangensis]RLQ81453.1 DUF222 domain-containing protein [Mycetocola zhadangensis]GGF01505.1 hypothetical protein GCM10011313_25830 [Mycetocola zhadangensis]